MNKFAMIHPVRAAALATAALLGLAGCSNDDDAPSVNTVIGTALSVLNGAPQAQRDFIVKDLEQPSAAPAVASGTSDSNGDFQFQLQDTITRIIVVFGGTEVEPRTSGLFAIGDTGNGKDLNDETDLACQAGVTAVGEGTITAAQLTNARIENLEAAARIEIDEDGVDFTDPDSVAAAVADIRAATNDGANPPAR